MFLLELLTAVVLIIAIVGIDGSILGWHMTTVEEGSMKFVVRGEDYVRTLLNVSDHRISRRDENAGKIEFGKPSQSLSPVRQLGFHWVSWIWPFKKIHQFKLVTGNLLPEQERKNKPIKQWVESRTHDTERLDFRIQSYVVVADVELADRFNVDLLIYALLEVVDPRLAVFVYKADFVRILGSAILSGYVDKSKGLSYADFVKEAKGRGSIFAAEVCKYINNGGEPDETKSLEVRYGVKLVETYVYDFQLSAEEQAAASAAKAAEIAKLQAEARVATADGEAKARIIEAEAKAKELGIAIKALKDEGVDPNTAMDGYTTIRATEAGAGKQTWVQRGAVAVGNLFPSKEEKS